MLKRSKEQGDEERETYAKFKCYCDQSREVKTASIKKLTQEIALLEANIQATQGSTGGLVRECADLKEKMHLNQKARNAATELRNDEHKAFIAQEKDLETALDQLHKAFRTLSSVGADQTDKYSADHEQFLANAGGLKSKGIEMASVRSEVK